MIGIELDFTTGLPKFRKDIWTEFDGTLPALATDVVIDSLLLSEFDSMRYKMTFIGQTQDDIRSLNMDVIQRLSNTRETVFGRLGPLRIRVNTQVNGTSFELLASNPNNFAVDYCLTVLTT